MTESARNPAFPPFPLNQPKSDSKFQTLSHRKVKFSPYGSVPPSGHAGGGLKSVDFACVLSHSVVSAPWTVAHQAPLSMEFCRQEYWSGLPFPTPEDLPNPGIEPTSLASPVLAGGFFTSVPPGKPQWILSRSKGPTGHETLGDTEYQWGLHGPSPLGYGRSVASGPLMGLRKSLMTWNTPPRVLLCALADSLLIALLA